MEIKFEIHGTQEGKEKNPIPYTRTTQGAKWSEKYQRYGAWKNFVQKAFLKNCEFEKNKEFLDMLSLKPIKKGTRGKVKIDIYFFDETHPDPDNVVKGVLDALFQDDKHIDVETKHFCRNNDPRIEVNIKIELYHALGKSQQTNVSSLR